MSIVDTISRISRAGRGAVLEPVVVKVNQVAAAAIDVFRKDYKMQIAKIDEKLVEARAVEVAAEAAHRDAAADYNLGFTEDDKLVSKRRRELVVAREKVEDLVAARAAAAINAAEADADAAAKADAEWTAKLEEAVDELVPLAQKVEEKIDELAAALSALWAGKAAITAMGARAKPADTAVLHALGGLPTLAWHKLHRLGIVPQSANYMLNEAEVGLVKRLPNPAVMIRMCPVPPSVAPGKGRGAGSYAVPTSQAVIRASVLG